MIHREPAAAYHARKALSAGMAWDIVSECPAYAWHHSAFNPERVEQNSLEFDIGSAAHLLTLEHNEFAERVQLIPYDDYRTKDARAARAFAYEAGRIPLRLKDERLVWNIHDALKRSAAAELLFGEGENEVSFTWEMWPPGEKPLINQDMSDPLSKPIRARGIPCKARADRIAGGHIIDLKTAASANPQAFQRAMVRDGHHLRAAWYLDGWREGGDSQMTPPERPDMWSSPDYLFVVVSKEPPHLVSVFRIDERSIEWGRMLYRKALAEVRTGMGTGKWRGYTTDGITTIGLPAFAEHRLAELEAQGDL